MAAIQDIQNLIAQAKPIPADLQKAALLEAQQQGLDNQALASVFGVPVSMISAAYEATGVTPAPAPAVESATIERLNHHQTAPGSLSPAATTTISSPFLPDATYNIPGFSLPDYRYSDPSGSGGGLSGGTGGSLTNYVTAVEPARSGPEGYTGPSISALPPGGGLGRNEFSLGNTTLDRGIGGGWSYFDGDSSTFHQDLLDQDAKEERRDIDYQNYLAKWQAHEDKTRLLANAASPEGGFDEGEIAAVTALLNSNAVTVEDISRQFDVPFDVVQAAFDANKPPSEGTFDLVEAWLAPTDTKNEFLEDIAAAIKNEGIVTENLQATTADKAGALDPNFTASQAAMDSGVGDLTTAKQNTKDVIDAALASGVVDQGDIDDAFGPTLVDTVLGGVGNVLSAGTGAIANVAGNIPVVGGYLEDAIEGTADWFANTAGSATINPIIGAVSGIWGIPDWAQAGSTSSIGSIANTNVGISTGNEQLDAIIGIITGDQDVGGDTTGAATGVNQAVLDAAKAAGTTAGELIDAGTATTALTDDEIAAEKEKNLAIATQVFEDAGGGADGVQAVLDTLEENDLTTADLSALTGVSEADINAFIDTTLAPSPEPPTPSPSPPTTITLTGGNGTTLSSDGTVMGPLTQEELDALGITPSPEPPTPSPEPPTPSPEPPTPSPEPPTPSPEPPRLSHLHPHRSHLRLRLSHLHPHRSHLRLRLSHLHPHRSHLRLRLSHLHPHRSHLRLRLSHLHPHRSHLRLRLSHLRLRLSHLRLRLSHLHPHRSHLLLSLSHQLA
jgi:hypothetical protein